MLLPSMLPYRSIVHMASNTVQMSYIHNPPLRPLEYRTLPQLLDVNANQHPDRDAFVFYSTTGQRSCYSFRQIQEMSLALAASFLRLGWKRGHKVVHMIPKQVEFVVSYIALLRIGVNAIVLPVHGRPADEVVAHMKRLGCHGYIMHADSATSFDIQGILTDIGPVVVISSDSNETHTGCRNYNNLLSEGKELGVDEVLRRQGEVQFDDPVTAVFTSGSTGRPKGVQHTHHSLVNAALLSPVSADDSPPRYFNDRPYCWIGGLVSILSIMANGSTSVTVPSIISVKQGNTDLVLSILQNEKCTVSSLRPYLMKDLLHSPKIKEYNLSSLKRFLIGGQTAPVSDLKRLKELFPHSMLVLMYGLSEAGACAVGIPILLPGTAIDDEAQLSMMKILPAFEVKIIDVTNKLVPLGTVGEIALRSPTTFLEYLNDPKETSKVLSPTGWLHTGDLGYLDDEGRIRICGRKTEVIQRATVKIYPAEIEEMLLKHPDVQSALVVGVPDARLCEELCACVILKSGSSLDEKIFEEWDYLKGSVDEQGLSMKPKYTIVMEEFPVTKTEKFDRKAMRKMAIEKLGFHQDEAY